MIVKEERELDSNQHDNSVSLDKKVVPEDCEENVSNDDNNLTKEESDSNRSDKETTKESEDESKNKKKGSKRGRKAKSDNDKKIKKKECESGSNEQDISVSIDHDRSLSSASQESIEAGSEENVFNDISVSLDTKFVPEDSEENVSNDNNDLTKEESDYNQSDKETTKEPEDESITKKKVSLRGRKAKSDEDQKIIQKESDQDDSFTSKNKV